MLMLFASVSVAQDVVVRGITVYGQDHEQNMPVILRDSLGRASGAQGYLTIQFDVQSKEPPSFTIRFLHCNRDWVPDRNLFVQDETHNSSFVLDYRTSPNGVDYYSYRYKNRFPDDRDIVRFNYSGNWTFLIMDKEETTVYGEGRFFVVDQVVTAATTVVNDYLTAAASPYNQIHKVQTIVRLPDEVDGYFYTTVDIYQNRNFLRPRRIDVNDRDPYTKVEGFNSGFRYFTALDILPGNEYRTLDVSDVTRYPHRMPVRLVGGVDLPRAYLHAGGDRDGTAILNKFTGIASDYLQVMFRLDLTALSVVGSSSVFVVGPFNDWNPGPDDELKYDPVERCHMVTKLLRRGIYDYQYVTGVWDSAAKVVTQQDWVVIEGNDWRTTNTYAAMVYYNDARFGGFDRIVGYGIVRSSGTASTH
jgi:hypothetical protein